MKTLKLLLCANLILFVIGCATTSLPNEYIECKNKYTNEIFRYVPEDAIVYPDAYCVVDTCIDWYEIIDLNGNERSFNNLELKNEWFCTIINRPID